MMTCERCGRAMPDNAAICPSCGTISSIARPVGTPPTEYGQNPGGVGNFGQAPASSGQPAYGQGYAPQSGYAPQQGYGPQQGYAAPQPGYAPQQGFGAQQGYAAPQPGNAPQQQGYGYGQQYGQPVMYQSVNINVASAPSQNSTPVIVEVLLSLFLGIYGVGWLMGGETTVGVVLLICSFVLYWPIMILGIIFTLGFGLFCLGPLAIGAIILNAILLNNAMKQKATQIVMSQSR